MTLCTKIAAPTGHSIHHVACPHDCPDTCSMLVTRDDRTGRAVRIQGDPTHPITRGYLCNKVNHYLDLVYNERRVLYPHARVGPKGPGARFERISWDDALDRVTANFKHTIAHFGSEAIQPFNYSGTLGMIGYWTMDNRFWNRMEAARLEMSICVHAAMWANIHTYGLANAPAIDTAAEEAELIILWGVNPVSTGVHAMPFLRAARERGCRVIAIDPRVTRTTMMADWHIQPRPGTDGALALGMMKWIVDHELHDREFLQAQTHGWEALLESRLPEFPVSRVAAITGVAAADIEALAQLYGSTRRSYIRGGHGLNRHQNSGQMCRAILVLPCLTGAWRERCGGAGFGRIEEHFGRVDLDRLQRPDLGNRASKRLVNMVQIGRALADDIGVDGLPLEPPIKHLFVYNSDPANCVPNSNNVRKGLSRPDLFVTVHDTFWTDTCAYADVVLPADTQLERTDFHGAYGFYHYAMNRPVIAPLGESVSNSALFRRLAARMGYIDGSDDAFTQTDEAIIRDILLDSAANPLMEGITYEHLLENGWALGAVDSPRRRYCEIGWPTPNGKIQIWCEALRAEGQDPLPAYAPEREGQEDRVRRAKYPLQVMSTATHHFIGDSFQSVPRLQAMQSRPTLELSPLEARKRDIVDGDLCRIHNDRGETYAHAVIIEGLIPGVCVTQKQFKGSNTPGGVNVNALTSETLSDFGFAPTFYSCLAEVEKVAGPRPDLTFRNLPELAREIRTPRVVAAAGVVQRLRKLTHDTYELAVRRAAAAPEIRAHAGQYATLKFDGVSRPRPYSFARAPAREAPREHSFIIRLVPGGEVSTWLAERARIGAPVEIRGPLGRFGLDDSRRPMICIAGGSGMSAIKALLEHACDVQAGRDCYFLYGARRQRDLYCEHEIRAISALWHPDYAFRFVQVLSDEPAGSDWHGPRGLVTEYLRDHVLGPGIVDAGRCKAFVCGPPPMVNAAAAVLAAAGIDPGDVAFDRFEDASSPAPVIDNAKCVLCDECLLVKPLANCIVEAARLGVDALGRVRMTERVRPASTSGLYYNSLLIDADECIRCYACVDACPQAAIAPANAPVVRSLRQPGA